MTISLPIEDRSYSSRNEMFENIVSFLGGRVAENLLLDDISTGASNDLERATDIARDMITRYGMSEKLGNVSYDSGSEIFVGRDYEKTKPYSERVAGDIDTEITGLMKRAYDKCTEILTQHSNKVEEISAFLLEHSDMSRVQFEACMEGNPIPEGVGDFAFVVDEEEVVEKENVETAKADIFAQAEDATSKEQEET